MALEIELLRQRRQPGALDLLRPVDTMQRGWRMTAHCDLCTASWQYHPPSDLRKCHWFYVVTQTACSTHRTRPADSIWFYDASGAYMGAVQRLS